MYVHKAKNNYFFKYVLKEQKTIEFKTLLKWFVEPH